MKSGTRQAIENSNIGNSFEDTQPILNKRQRENSIDMGFEEIS